jgi:peptide/nickel transport system substrate-binding protein
MSGLPRWLGLAGALAVAACAPPQVGQTNNSVVFASQDVLESADPYFSTQLVSAILADHVFDGLVYQDPATGAYEGNLATSWRRVDDLTLEFELRRGVRFHNGEPFDADDVVYSFNFLANPSNRAVYLSLIRWLDRAEKVDDYTVRVISREPFPAALAYLSNSLFAVQPNDYHARVGPRGVNAAPVGTGPYRVAEYATGKSIRLLRNTDFHDGLKRRPTIDEVLIRFIPDPQTRVAEAVSGGVDFIFMVAPDQAEQLRASPRLTIAHGEGPYYHYLQLSTLEGSPAPQLRDVRVRQAILHAIDRDAMAINLAGGGRVIHVACHPLHFGCDDAGAPRYDYDPDKARRLLAEAGFPTGFPIDLMAFRNRNQSEALVGYLQAVGIEARLRFLQYSAVRTAIRSNRVGLVHGGWNTVTLDVSNSTSQFFAGSTDDLNRDPEVRALLVSGDSSLEPTERKAAYARALALIQERAYVLPLYAEPVYYVTNADLIFQPTPDGRPRFYEMGWR